MAIRCDCDEMRCGCALGCYAGARTWGSERRGAWGQQRAPGCLRRARSASAAASCLSGIRGSGGGVGRCAEGDWGEIGVRLGARGRPLGDWARRKRGAAQTGRGANGARRKRGAAQTGRGASDSDVAARRAAQTARGKRRATNGARQTARGAKVRAAVGGGGGAMAQTAGERGGVAGRAQRALQL